MNFFGFGSTPEIEIILDGQDRRRMAEIKTEEGQRERHPLYYDGETISGQVKITMRRSGSKFEHQGIRIELIGQVELYYDRGTPHFFLSLYKDLARPGELLHQQMFNFEFIKVEKPYESYTGANCKLRYFLRVSIIKRLTDIVKERELVVHTISQFPDMNSSIKMEVGIEDCLHIEFEYNRSKYHLKDVIVGKIYFLLVRIKVKHMELAIIRRETTGSGPNTFTDNENIAKFEIMDGAPVRGESIPIRVFLAGYDLTPTYRDVNRKFSVRYYLNLVLVDEEERRYFKQQEIILWRKVDKPRKPFLACLQQQYREMQNPNAQVLQTVSEEPQPSTSKHMVYFGDHLPGCTTCGGSTATASSEQTNEETGQQQETEEEEVDKGILKSIAAMTMTNVDDNIVPGQSQQMSEMDDQFSTHAKEKQSNDNRVASDKPASSLSSVLLAAGLCKTLSGDSDDDDVPTLTGSICQADVHSVSHEIAVDAATIVEDVGDAKEQGGNVAGKGKVLNNSVGKEE